MKTTDKQALMQWEAYRYALINALHVDTNETQQQKKTRITKLEADPESWFAYYFEDFYTCKPAKFQVEATKRLLSSNRIYEVRAWARELAKSVRGMMEDIYMALMGIDNNMLLVSNSYENAVRLLMPYMINFESNPRIINDYGKQAKLGFWEAGNFTIVSGCSFRAIGAGQSPRGTRNKANRPDKIRIDDIDTDEETRNPKRIKEKWEWVEKALIPTVSVSGNYKIIYHGNIIAKDCIIARAIQKADYVDIVNIRDKNGHSVWPDKNTEQDIDDMFSKISYASAQAEYYNNPISEGSVFKEITWGEVPEFNKLNFVVAYGDPATSNKDNKTNSYKSLFLLGEYEQKFYVITGFLDRVNNATFVQWYFTIEAFVRAKTQLLNYIENNSLQDPFFEQVFTPLFFEEAKKQGTVISIRPDERKKPDKFARIEGNLEPLNRTGRLIFNIKEKANPHMQRLEEQFKLIEPGLPAPADGPDCIEGGVDIIKRRKLLSRGFTMGKRNTSHNNKKY